jgi:hypothetical protein
LFTRRHAPAIRTRNKMQGTISCEDMSEPVKQ